MRLIPGISTFLLAASLASCGHEARETVAAGTGPTPALPAPSKSLIPTVVVSKAVGWEGAATPTPAAGLAVAAFARGLDHPRWLYVLPNGDVLVAETNGPNRPDDDTGLKGWIMKKLMAKAGAAPPSANKIILLRDRDHDGVAEFRSTFLAGLNSPFGMALIGDSLYVANTDGVRRYDYHTGDSAITGAGAPVAPLPAGPINHHWTKNILASSDGTKLYITVGSNSNVGENGIAAETGRAAIYEMEIATGKARPFATGLRNPNGLAWEPESGALWTAVNERDELGSDLVPDYMTSVHEGAFYGWPYSYYGPHVDNRINPPRPDLVAAAVIPDYALGPHTASLGLAFNNATALGTHYTAGAFIGQHGSWNRKPRSGYKVIFVPFAAGHPAGAAEDVLTDFLDAQGNARGRPVGVTFDKNGALLVADDVGNVIWRVTAGGHQ